MNELLWINESAAYSKEAKAVMLSAGSASTVFDERGPLVPIQVADYRVAPWGPMNLLPQHVINNVDKVEIVGTNAEFNWKVPYGNGPKLIKLVFSDNPREQVRDSKGNIIGGKIIDKLEIFAGEIFEWCERNDISLFLQETLSDLSYFHNAFPALVVSKDWKSIETIRNREAVFSRWALDSNDNIIGHLYCGKWDEAPASDNIEFSYVIDEYNAIDDIKKQMLAHKNKRLIYPVYTPSPGRPYYSYPSWWSIFRSGWYDNIASIPELKKTILKHKLGVKHIIYISPAYFEDKMKLEGINPSDMKAVNDLKKRVVEEINNALMGEDNAGKALSTLKRQVASGNGVTTEKYFEIEEVKSDIEGGEYLTDYETGANIISYAMEVHPSLIGATPGKNSNSLSGSNQRELYLMKQALSKPMMDRALRPFNAIKKINQWPADYVISVPEFMFTTLDQAKSGKIESTNSIAK